MNEDLVQTFKKVGQTELGDVLAQTELIPADRVTDLLGTSPKIDSSVKNIELNMQKTSDGVDLTAIEEATLINQNENHHIVMRNSGANTSTNKV